MLRTPDVLMEEEGQGMVVTVVIFVVFELAFFCLLWYF
jgi:hypothetical protein